jgi:restriction system protein
MSRAEQESGLSDVLFGRRWQTAAWRAVLVFIVGYVLPRAVLAPASGLAGFLQLLATVLSFGLTTAAVYQLLQSRAAVEWVDEDEAIAEPASPVGVHDKVVPLATPPGKTSETLVPAAPSALAIETLGQVALERLCMALYRFNGLNSQTVASGAGGEYRIRLVPRNTDKATAILHCYAGREEQGVPAYAALLRIMEEEGLEKAFFVAPAGFAAAVAAEARSRHVTLMDLNLLHAMIDRLPDSARALITDAAAGL